MWERVRDAYLGAIPGDAERQALASFYEEMETGGHAHAQARAHDGAHAHEP